MSTPPEDVDAAIETLRVKLNMLSDSISNCGETEPRGLLAAWDATALRLGRLSLYKAYKVWW